MHRQGIAFGQGLVFLVGHSGILSRDRIIGFFARTEVLGIFADDGSVLALLTSGVLDLDDARELFIVGIIYLHGGLVKAKRAFDGRRLRADN